MLNPAAERVSVAPIKQRFSSLPDFLAVVDLLQNRLKPSLNLT
jgi:hypothetical protein